MITAAKRLNSQSYKINFNPSEYEKFSSTFPFIETDDQANTIDEVIADFSKSVPADRLIVGDVAFGKTEVIIRAVFLAAKSKIQSLVLVPTTLLSRQHYENFSKRFEIFNIKVGEISRLISQKEKYKIFAEFKKGNINYLSEDFYLIIYLFIIISFIFVFFNFDNNFLNILVSITSSVSNLGISFEDSPKNLSFIFLILVIIGGSFFSTSSGLRVIKVLSLIKFSLNNLLSHSKPNQIYLNKVSLTNSNTNKADINKYFLTIIIFVISLFTITLLLTISEIDLEKAFKIGILTIMNTVNSPMYGVSEFDFYNLSIFAKFTLIVFMIVGRIELLTIFILFKRLYLII